MSTDLERFRDHCREMAGREHKPECEWPSRAAVEKHNHSSAMFERLFEEPEGTRSRVEWCSGCNSGADRALFVRLADEVDAYLTNDDAPLWEDA